LGAPNKGGVPLFLAELSAPWATTDGFKSILPFRGALNAKEPLASHGQHVVLDLTGYVSPGPEEGAWVLNVLRDAVARSGAREVHAHVESFDGVISPPGFAAVVLLDESHLSAHCYSDRGWLAIDCFTCGGTNAEGIVEDVLNAFTSEMPDLVVHQRAVMNRFLHPEEG
jgi:S-adenosylmethionine decarboxylase